MGRVLTLIDGEPTWIEARAFLTTTPGTQVTWTRIAPPWWQRFRHPFANRPKCDVYWGTHGCERRLGHRGEHRCGSGCPPFNPTYAFGKDWHGA